MFTQAQQAPGQAPEKKKKYCNRTFGVGERTTVMKRAREIFPDGDDGNGGGGGASGASCGGASSGPAPFVWEDLPSDTLLAVQALRPYALCAAFPLPLFPLSVLSGYIGPSSSLLLRQELSELASNGTVRELHLGNASEGTVVAVLCSDLEAFLRAERAAAGGDAARGRALGFFSSLLARHPTPHVSQADVAVAYREWLKASAGGAGGGGGKASGFGVDKAERLLLSMGLLLQRPDRSFYFGAPGGMQYSEALKRGRAELVQKVGKAAGRQLSRAHLLEKVALKKTPLPTLIHLRDALGLGLLTTCIVGGVPHVRFNPQAAK
jgi:hypothetical protein